MLPRPSPDIIFKRVSDGAVLLDRRSEVYFGLNVVGARVWEMLPPACETVSELCGILEREYPDVGTAALRADVVELLDELAENGLVEPAGSEDDQAVQEPRD